MGTLTPRKVSHPTEVSPLHVTRPSRPFCFQTPQAPPSPLSHATPQRDGFPLTGSRLRHWLAGSSGSSGRIDFVSCGLVSRLRLLSTSPLGDAVTFGFQAGERVPGEDLHLYTCALAGALARWRKPREMKEFPGTHSPARGGRSSSTTPDFAGKERGERRGVMFYEEFLPPLRGSGETGSPSFPGAYATGLMPAALRAGRQKMCVILWH
jgi:hypothetical protein